MSGSDLSSGEYRAVLEALKARVRSSQVKAAVAVTRELVLLYVDGPTIGLLLCRAKNRVVAEYALRDIDKPIGVADIQLTRLLPERLEGTLPTVEELEAELAGLPEKDEADDDDV